MNKQAVFDPKRHALDNEDPRVVRTRALISDAFLELLDANPLSKITVSAIATKAGVNRKTFYLHFSSVEELVEYEARRLANRIMRETARVQAQTGGPDLRTIFVELMTLTAERPNLYRRILREIPLNRLVDLLAIPMCERVVAGMGDIDEHEARTYRYLVRYYVAGTLATFMQYLEEDDTPSTAEIMQLLDSAGNVLGSQLKLG